MLRHTGTGAVCWAIALGITAVIGTPVFAGAPSDFTVDFETDDLGLALQNGQIIDSEFNLNFSISTSGPNQIGGAIFDSSPAGANSAGSDEDLLVDLGNVLILQNPDFAANDGFFFDTPNDTAGGGEVLFDFTSSVELLAIDLVDIDENAALIITLTDGSGLNRVYNVPSDWTVAIDNGGAIGFGTLDFTTLLDQFSDGPGGAATAMEDAGFNSTDVVSLNIDMSGSGAIDNLRFRTIPAPASALALLGLFAGRGRQRRN